MEPITYMTHEEMEELLTVEQDSIVYVINKSTNKPGFIKLSTLVQTLSSVDFEVDGGSFI